MPASISLQREGTGDLIDLYDGTDGIKTRQDGWIQRRASQNMDGSWGTVEEVLSLRIDGDDGDGIAAKVQPIDQILRRASEYANRATGNLNPVHILASLDGETGTRRSLILNGQAEPAVSLYGRPVSNTGIVRDYRLAITRHPHWERITTRDAFQGLTTNNEISSVGGMANYTEIPGDVPARISRLIIKPADASLPLSGFYEAWIGFHSNEYGSRDEFESNWDLGDSNASFFNDTARAEYLGSKGAYGNWLAEWQPDDTDMLARVVMRIKDVTTFHTEQNGTFIVLARMRRYDPGGGANRVFHVRLLSGYYDEYDASKWRFGAKVAVPNIDPAVATDDFYYYPMGIVTIPPERVAFSSVLRQFGMALQAQVSSGTTGYLHMDCLTLIPISEGAIHIKGAYIYKSGINNYWVYVVTSPDDETVAYNYVHGPLTDYSKTLQCDPTTFSLPTGYGVAVAAIQRESQQVLYDVFSLDLKYYPRWLTLRGSSSP